MSQIQFSFPFSESSSPPSPSTDLDEILAQDLDFHDLDSRYASHNFHSFPAKFPPQLPHQFIKALTNPGDVVLDPMQGSGTTVLEAVLTGRRAVGTDIDPLALLITRVKTTPLAPMQVLLASKDLLRRAHAAFDDRSDDLLQTWAARWDEETHAFVDYWFDKDTQLALLALILEIEKIKEPAISNFFKLAFSAIIITKSGGVSLALDLAHTHPHRAKLIYNLTGEIVEGAEFVGTPIPNLAHATKHLRLPFIEFEKRVHLNLKGLIEPGNGLFPALVNYGNAEGLPIASNSIDLIVTSPPYASNAIDYMRAHKFSLVWFGHPIAELSEKRGEYIGGEMVEKVTFEQLPILTAAVVIEISSLDENKGHVLQRYYSEMTRVLREMYRVLKPGKSAILVVGSSVMRGRDTQTQNCLKDIGESLGFEVPRIGVRNLDRNRRMMPVGMKKNLDSQIQQRMHEEYVIGFLKP